MSSDCCPTIPELLVLQASHYGGREAVASTDGASLTFAELAATIENLQASLVNDGVSRGSRVAVVLPNGLDRVIGLLAASSAGIAVPLPANAAVDEYRSWLRVGRVTHLLTSAAGAAAVRVVAEELGLSQIELRHEAGRYRIHAAHALVRRAETSVPQPTDAAVVLMTSGSTGTPKRVPLTHANLLAGAKSVAESLSLGISDRVLVMWEQHHIGGLVDLLLAPLVSGGTSVCAGSFNAARFYELLDRVQPTWFQGVPATLRELLVQARLSGGQRARCKLRFLRSVAAPLPPHLMAELESAFQVPVIQTFGMTEASPLITTNRLPPGLRKPGSVGTACGCEVTTLDAAGEPLPPGATGEIAVRGPNVFMGYENDADANTRLFQHDWFRTGDVGRFDADGFLFLTGRVKEMINRGGEKIAPAEIEAVAVRHPAVSQAAAFAIPHPTLGEDIGLAVVLRDSNTVVNRDGIRTYLAQHLSRFKLPVVLLVLADLPRCPIGKIRRGKLADLAAASMRATRPQSTPTAVDDPLLTRLTCLWAAHLDLPSVDPDADFEVLGGDSLARVRLVVAVESLCDISIPEAAAATITTARQMAAEVRRLGGRLPRLASGPVENTVNPRPDRWGDGDPVAVVDASAPEIHQRLAECRTIHEFEAIRESLLNVLTPEELTALAAEPFTGRFRLWRDRLFSVLPRRIQAASLGRVALAVTSWLDELRAIRPAAAKAAWRRVRLRPAALVYQRAATLAGRRLVIGFAGNHQRLMLPTHVLLDHLPPNDDLLLLFDPDRQHFAAGIRGIAATLPEVCSWIGKQCTDWGYEELVSFGTSAGGLAAIFAGHALGCQRAVAVGCDAPDAHPALLQLLRDQIATIALSRQAEIVLAYDPANHRDRRGSEALAALVTTSQAMILSASGGHNTLRPALTAGKLRPLLHDLLGPRSGSFHDERAA